MSLFAPTFCSFEDSLVYIVCTCSYSIFDAWYIVSHQPLKRQHKKANTLNLLIQNSNGIGAPSPKNPPMYHLFMSSSLNCCHRIKHCHQIFKHVFPLCMKISSKYNGGISNITNIDGISRNIIIINNNIDIIGFDLCIFRSPVIFHSIATSSIAFHFPM